MPKVAVEVSIKYLAIREHLKENKIVIEDINIELMIIDPLTKGMRLIKYKDYVTSMRIGSIM